MELVFILLGCYLFLGLFTALLLIREACFWITILVWPLFILDSLCEVPDHYRKWKRGRAEDKVHFYYHLHRRAKEKLEEKYGKS